MRRKKLPIYCADFETTSLKQYELENETRVYLWCLKSVDESYSGYGVDMDSFFETLYSLNEEKIICYFHNLSFDGEFINWWLVGKGYRYKENVLDKIEDNTFSPIIDEVGSIYSIRVIYKGMYIEFRCSYKLFPKSIEDIGEMVGVKKLKEIHDYESIKNYDDLIDVPDDEIMYINNDVLIMCRLIKYLDSVGINAITMSSSAYKNWRMDKYQLCKHQFIKDENDEINEIVRKSYRGGITKVNPKYAGQLLHGVISFDVNSLYPSVMYENKIPIGMGKIYKTIDECIKDRRYAYIVEVLVKNAEVKKGYHAFIGEDSGFTYSRKYNYSDKLLNKTLYLWDTEFRLFNKIYDNDSVIVKVVGYKTANNVFTEYIDRWYSVKENAKTPAERQLAKLMLNSLYGKFGMNDARASKIPVEIREDEIIYRIIETFSCYYDKKVASFITSKARVKYATFMNLCFDKFVYGDTDSIYYLSDKIPDIFKDIVDDKKMGFWKYEGYYPRFKALKAKCYIKEVNGKINVKVSGCPKECASKINFDNFQIGLKLEDCKKVKRKVKGGIVIDTTDFTIGV